MFFSSFLQMLDDSHEEMIRYGHGLLVFWPEDDCYYYCFYY